MDAKRILVIILGVLVCGLGISCFMYPAAITEGLAWVLGVVMIVEAVGSIISWKSLKDVGMADGFTLAGAIVSLVLGIALVVSFGMQLAFTLMIAYMTAFWLVFSGVMRIVASINVKRAADRLVAAGRQVHWIGPLILGVVMAICGVLGFIFPMVMVVYIGYLIAISVVVAGLCLISLGVMVMSE